MHRFAKQHRSRGTSSTWTVSHLAQQKEEERDRGTDEFEVSYCFFKTRKRSKWLPTAEIACFHSSLCAFSYSYSLYWVSMYQKWETFWHTVMLAYAIPSWLENDLRTRQREVIHEKDYTTHAFLDINSKGIPRQEMNFGLSNIVIETCDHALVVRRVVGKCPKAACLPCP
jgi:hypothetical protein